MALLTTQPITQLGVTPTYANASANGDTVNAKARGFLHVKNSGSSTTLTIAARVAAYNAPGFGDIPISDIVVTIPATTGDKMVEIPPESHGIGGASLAWSQVTGITVAYFELPPV